MPCCSASRRRRTAELDLAPAAVLPDHLDVPPFGRQSVGRSTFSVASFAAKRAANRSAPPLASEQQ